MTHVAPGPESPTTLEWLFRLHWIILGSLFTLVVAVEQSPSVGLVNAYDLLLLTALAYLALYGLHVVHRSERHLPSLLFMVDGFLVASAVVLSGGPVSYYTPLFLVTLAGATLTCTPRAVALVAVEHVTLYLAAVEVSMHPPHWLSIPRPDPEDMMSFLAAAPEALRAKVIFEQDLRWGVFLGLMLVLCSVLVRQVWVREERLRSRERALEQKRRLIQLGELTGRIAHGVNTPLGLLSGHLEMMLAETRKGTKLHKSLTELDGFLQRAITMVRKTLDYSRQSMSQIRTVALKEILDTVVEAVQPKLERHKGRLILDVAPKLPPFKGYPEGLFQAFLNVMENAVDSLPPEGGLVTLSAVFELRHLRLSASDRRGEILVTVRDTGSGISPSDMEHIFEPFYSTKDFGQGTGLGLSIAKRVLEEHQGTVRVESKLGQGTAVTLSFPAEDQAQETAAPGV